MRRDGCLDSESELKEFYLGFTQAKASFDFIDVGHGKERADSKIKGMLYLRLDGGVIVTDGLTLPQRQPVGICETTTADRFC